MKNYYKNPLPVQRSKNTLRTGTRGGSKDTGRNDKKATMIFKMAKR